MFSPCNHYNRSSWLYNWTSQHISVFLIFKTPPPPFSSFLKALHYFTMTFLPCFYIDVVIWFMPIKSSSWSDIKVSSSSSLFPMLCGLIYKQINLFFSLKQYPSPPLLPLFPILGFLGLQLPVFLGPPHPGLQSSSLGVQTGAQRWSSPPPVSWPLYLASSLWLLQWKPDSTLKGLKLSKW